MFLENFWCDFHEVLFKINLFLPSFLSYLQMGNKFSNLSVGDCDQESLLPLWDLQELASRPCSIYLQVISKCAFLMILKVILLVLVLMFACMLTNEDSGRCGRPWLWGFSSNMLYTCLCCMMGTFFSRHLSRHFMMLNLSFIM
jgi:hypothetical protein